VVFDDGPVLRPRQNSFTGLPFSGMMINENGGRVLPQLLGRGAGLGRQRSQTRIDMVGKDMCVVSRAAEDLAALQYVVTDGVVRRKSRQQEEDRGLQSF
jgi:hypothetical protein